jgi:hypothetical protein
VNRLGHQAAAQFAWLGYAAYSAHSAAPMGWQEIACGMVVASSMCADDWSPDADQGGWVAKILPGGHRGVSHMPELVLVGLWVIHHYVSGRGYDWFILAAGAGWLSHLIADACFGRIPLLILGGRRVGFTFKTGSRVEAALTWVLSVGCLPLAWVAFGGPL